MSFQNRKQAILKIVEEKDEVEVGELAQYLGISEITIRRDLTLLAADGLVYRTHGGAMKPSLAQAPFTFTNKIAVNANQKDLICRMAAQEIQERDVIFMDCGSTVFRLCQFIKNKKIKVITNSLPVVYELINTQVSINLIGGELDSQRQAIHGRIAEEHMARYQATKAFVGTDGLSVAKGLSALSEKEASITLAMAKNAQTTYLLCDASKLGQDKYFPFAPLSLIQVLVTDADKSATDVYQQQGLRIICEE